MLTLRDILFGGVVPFAIALVVLAIGWWTWRRESRGAGFDVVRAGDANAARPAADVSAAAPSTETPAPALRSRRAWAGPVAVGAAFAAGYVLLFGVPAFPPVGSSQWLVFLTVPLVVLGLLDALLRVPAWLTAVLVVVAAGATSWLLLNRLVPGTFETVGALWMTVAATAVPAAIWWISLDGLASRRGGAGAPLVFLVVAGGVAGVLLTSGSQTVGQLAGLSVAALAAAAVVAWWTGGPVLARGAAVPFVVLTLGLLTYARFYFDPPPTALNLGLLLVAPVIAWLADQAVPRRVRGWKRSTLVVAAALVPVAVALTLSVVKFLHEMSQTSYDGYSY